MDFGGELFWVLMLIFYLVFQVLGARKKTQEKRKRRPMGLPEGPPARETHEATELDEALSEIRRALGYRDERRAEPAPAEAPTQPVEKPLEELSARAEPSRMPPAQREPAGGGSIRSQPSRIPPPRREPLKGRSVRDEPTRMPPRREPLEGRSLRNEPTRIPPTRREPSASRHVKRRTAVPGGSIYAADEKAAFGAQDLFEKLDETRPSLAAAETPRRSLVGIAQSEEKKESRLPHLVKRLQSPSSAREAVLMKEILDRPRALRRRY